MIKVIDEVINDVFEDVFEKIDFCGGYAISTRVYDVVWKSDVGALLQDVVTESMREQL